MPGRSIVVAAILLGVLGATPASAADAMDRVDPSDRSSLERLPARIATDEQRRLAGTTSEPAPGTVGLTSVVAYDTGEGTALVVAEAKNNTTVRRVGTTVEVKYYDDDGFLGVTYHDTTRVERLSFGARSPFWITVPLPEATEQIEVSIRTWGAPSSIAAVGGLTVTPTGSSVEDDVRTWTATITNPSAFAVRAIETEVGLFDSTGAIIDAWLGSAVEELGPGASAPIAVAFFDDPDAASVTFVVEARRVGSPGYVTSWNNYFDDVGNSTFRSSIEWLAAERITGGCAPGRYCPQSPVRRDQMASFLARSLGLTGSAPDAFVDDEGNLHEASIDRIAAARITGGCDVVRRRYCPSDPVPRDQMASFLVRSLGLTGAAPDAFRDDEGNTHEASIDRLAAAGITGGCGPTTYCPRQLVTRGQMAAFLRRAFDD